MRTERENGIALITVLLILFMVSALVVGMSWMVMSDQRLGGNNQNRETSFYGAEAGMEKMTADMGNIFAQQGAVTAANLVTITGAPPLIPGVTYANTIGSTYRIGCPDPTVLCGVLPPAQNATIRAPSPYAGMTGLIQPFTLSVAAQSALGAEVKLQRQIQLVAIPVFQFGIFSNTDLAFFNGPPFDFGGRVHTNGNLWLAADSGPLYLADKVTVVGQVIRTNLENGTPTVSGGAYGGGVTIALVPSPATLPGGPSYTNAQWRALALTEGSVKGNSAYGAVSTTANNPTWTNTVVPAYGGMLQNGVQPLNLISTALGGLQTPVALIRRPAVGEQVANPAQFNQRYFSNNNQASLRILLDDYPAGSGPLVPNACNGAAMMQLDTISAGNPVDLATLAFDPGTGFNYNAGSGRSATAPWYTGLPLPLSKSPSLVPTTAYVAYSGATPGDGYWQVQNTPIITGCIKIEVVGPGAAGAATDVTQEILNLGVTGRNIYPETNVGAANQLLYLPNSGTVAAAESATCGGNTDASEPSPNAVIRIARLRDNPSTAYAPTKNACVATTSGYDYWPMVLYDTREGVIRDTALPNNGSDNSHPYITAEGVMNYIELDVNNLSRWFTKAIGVSGNLANSVGGYEVYFSDRRGNQVDPTPGTNTQTGAFGFNDIVNRSSAASGCPDGVLDQPGEDFEGDGVLRLYGGTPLSSALVPPNQEIPALISGTPVMLKNPNCPAAATAPSPVYVYTHAQEARENPPVFFRRALKVQYGVSFNLGTACFGGPTPPCGLTIVAENPVYLQGDYNNAGAPTNFSGASVASSIAADAVTLLSDSWNDVNSFISPYAPGSRKGSVTTYRTAIIAGKGIPFAQTAGSGPDYGTDGGLHNFLRYLEGWGSNLYYQGSLVSFYYNRQALGAYKCCTTVYGPPTRVYAFDPKFTQGPQWLPPRTPTLRSINTIGFTQMMNPNQ